MKVRDDLEIDEDRLADICRRYRIKRLWLFGSVLRDDFDDDSDIDVLYEGELHESDVPWAIVRLKEELTELFGREVDPVGWKSVHWYIREEVHADARPLYAA